MARSRYSRSSRKRRYRRGGTSNYSRYTRVKRWGTRSRRSSRSGFRRKRSSPANWSIKKLKYWLKRKSALRSFSRKERSKARFKRQWKRIRGAPSRALYKRLGKKMLRTDSDAQALASRGEVRYLFRITGRRDDKTTWVSVGPASPYDPTTKIRELTDVDGKFISSEHPITLSYVMGFDRGTPEATQRLNVKRSRSSASTAPTMTTVTEETMSEAGSSVSGWSASTSATSAWRR